MLPELNEYLPTSHRVQLVLLLSAAGMELKDPIGHSRQLAVVALWYCPGGHKTLPALQFLAPASLVVPSGHVKQAVLEYDGAKLPRGHCRHDVPLVKLAKVPGSQGIHEEAAATLAKLPGAHDTQLLKFE